MLRAPLKIAFLRYNFVALIFKMLIYSLVNCRLKMSAPRSNAKFLIFRDALKLKHAGTIEKENRGKNLRKVTIKHWC